MVNLEISKKVIKYYHWKQKRKSWELFYTHPLFVGDYIFDNFKGNKKELELLANLWLLHDTLEDTEIKEEFIIKYYWNIFFKKLKKLSKNYYDDKEEWFRYISKDIDAIIIKSIDRLHNLNTIWSLSNDAQIKNIIETETFIIPMIDKSFMNFNNVEDIDKLILLRSLWIELNRIIENFKRVNNFN